MPSVPAHTLPTYTLRVSPRARNILLKAVPHQGLVVVLPKGASARDAERAVAGRLEWVEAALAKLEAQGRLGGDPLALPQELRFLALERRHALQFLPVTGARPKLTLNAGNLLVKADLDQPEAILTALRAFVARTARMHLPPLLRETSQRLGLPFAEARVRTQRSRWASCTASGNIQLNAKLLFLPRPLVEHIFVHELCHTRHHNHGTRFHALLCRLSPRAKEYERALAQAGRYVPAWMEC